MHISQNYEDSGALNEEYYLVKIRVDVAGG